MQPEKLGRYRILSELGRGAMGQVYLAYDPEIDRKVAIKTIQIFAALPEHERQEARERFLREARSAGRLLHPGIVTLFDVGEADGALYLAMEYVEGSTLDHFCEAEHLLPVSTVVEMAARAAEALHYAHQADIIHRDIKPANLMRVDDSAVKIMDFGLAKPSEGQLTRDGALLGTPSYMSPEQIRGEQLDGRSDLFSLGVVLFELLTGERPFPGDSISSIIYRIVNDEPRDASEFADRVPVALSGFLQKALAKDPDERFADGDEFAATLRRAAASVEDGAEQLARPSAPPPVVDEAELPAAERTRPKRSSMLPFIIVVVVLIGAAGGAVWYFKDELGWFDTGPPPVPWFETRVRAEPPEARIEYDGVPLDPASGGQVRFQPMDPPATVSAELDCRRAEHALLPEDADGEVVLVLDPIEMSFPLEPGVDGAEAKLNGEAVGRTPLDLALNLCEENRLELEADGHRPASVQIPAGATPLDARRLLSEITFEEIPKGTLALRETETSVTYYVDGNRVGKGVRRLELPEGRHTIRLRNDTYWIDVRIPVEIKGGETATPRLRLPALTTLVVQAFPANCKVYLRRPGGSWKYVDDTPARRKIAVGEYEVRVKLNPTGETREQTVKLEAGENPPVRVSFGRGS